MNCPRTFWCAFGLLLVASIPAGEKQQRAKADVAAPEVSLPALGPGNRGAVGAALSTKRGSPGESVGLYLKIKVAPGYHIYSLDENGGKNPPTAIKVKFEPAREF